MQDFQATIFMRVSKQSSKGRALPKGVHNRYNIERRESSHETAKQFLTCDTEKSFLRGITRFHNDGLNVCFLSRANSEGTRWELENVEHNCIGHVAALDIINPCWQLTTPQGRMFEIYEQTKVGKNILRSRLGCWPDAYACVEGNTEIGAIRRDEFGDARRSLRPSFLGRVRKMLVGQTWTFTHTAIVTPEEELLLISGMLAIIEITVPGYRLDESTGNLR